MLLNFVDKSFDIKRLIYYRLSIQISLNGFSFCVFDENSSRHVILRNYQYTKSINSYDDLITEIDLIFQKDNYLSFDYIYCTCVYISPKHTLIPNEVFIKEKLRTYLEFIAPLDELDEIHYYNFRNTNICSIFAIPSQVASKLISYYKKILFISQSTPLINSCLKIKDKEGTYNGIHINLNDGTADIAIIVNNQFQLHNSYQIFHLNDAVYYIGALLHQFNLKFQQTPVYISGDILKEEIDELTKYFSMLRINNNHRMSILIGYENSYRYFNLLIAHECE